MSKTYEPQLGPNLAIWNIRCKPGEMIGHSKNCGGMLVQDLGRGFFRASQLPDHSAGKIFCYECGHRVGKSAARAIRGGTEGEDFYFPDKQNYEIRTLSFVEGKTTYRYWEWRIKEQEKAVISAMLDSIIGKEKRPMARSMPPLKKLPKRALVRSDSADWIVDHPKVLIRFPREECSKAEAEQVSDRLSSFDCRNYDRDELIEEAMRLFSAEGVEVQIDRDPFRIKDTVSLAGKLILKCPRGLVVFDSNYWDVTAFRLIRQELRAAVFETIGRLKQWVEVKVTDDGMEKDSVVIFPGIRYEEARDYVFQPISTAR